MTSYHTDYANRIEQEILQTPDKYLPILLEIIQLFRQSIELKPAAGSFTQGWQEVLKGETLPISDLWSDINA